MRLNIEACLFKIDFIIVYALYITTTQRNCRSGAVASRHLDGSAAMPFRHHISKFVCL